MTRLAAARFPRATVMVSLADAARVLFSSSAKKCGSLSKTFAATEMDAAAYDMSEIED